MLSMHPKVSKIRSVLGYMVGAFLMLLPPYNLICWAIEAYRQKRHPRVGCMGGGFFEFVLAPVFLPLDFLGWLRDRRQKPAPWTRSP